MKRIVLIVAVVLVLAAIVTASIMSGDRKKKTKVYSEEVTRQDISQIVKCSGQINPRVKVNISAHVIGKIETLYVEEGQEIEQGDPFLELEKESFVAIHDNAVAQLAIQKSQLRQAEIDLADADLKLRRAQRLVEEGILPDEQLEAAELRYRSAELAQDRSLEAIRQAQANLEKAVDDLKKTTIYSPLSGRVIELHAEQGEVVVSGTMNNPASIIGVVADLSEILTEVDIDETEIVDVALGQDVKILVDALPDLEYQGKVVEIGSSGYERRQQPDVTFFKVKILLVDPDDRLRPGMSARADIGVTTHEGVLVVPLQAVLQRPPLADQAEADSPEAEAEAKNNEEEIQVVFVIDDEEAARQTSVQTGISDATHIEILAGLEEGQKVITGPYRALKKIEDGDPVKERSEGEAEEEDDEGEED